jgi:signal transduction histidine kinase
VRSCPLEGEGGALLAFDALDHLCDEYVAMVAHDLRNPLQAMMLQLELLLRHHSGESAVQVPIAALRRLSRNGQRLARLVQDLLDSARIEGGRVHLDREPLELPRVVAELVQQLELTLGNHPVQLRVEGEPQVVLADPLRLEQILTNLLENAAKFSSEGSPIEVTMARSNGGARVTVCDRGPGIPPEDLPGLFDRHHQAKRAREKRSGLGLGLYIARGMVDAHGGARGHRPCDWCRAR